MSSFFSTESPSTEKPSVPVTNIHAMIDIETMGTSPQSPILTIGAVLFDPHVQNDVMHLEERAFLRRIDIADSIEHSGGVEPDTLKWWLQQEDAAIKALVTGETVTLEQALLDFRNYCVDRNADLERKFFPGWSSYPVACILWAKSPDFDCKIMENACKAVNERMPMMFFQYRCVRTLQDLCWPDGPDSRPKFKFGTAHDAAADAVNQALMVQAGYKELGLSNKETDVEYSTF
jgi:exodeoxyribonuclease VIII